MNGSEGLKAGVALVCMLAIVLMGFVVVVAVLPTPPTHSQSPGSNNTTRQPPPPPPPPPRVGNFSALLNCTNSSASRNGTVLVTCHVIDAGVAPFTYAWSATNATERVHIAENGSAWLNMTFHLNRGHGCMSNDTARGFWLEVVVRTGDSRGRAVTLSERVGVGEVARR